MARGRYVGELATAVSMRIRSHLLLFAAFSVLPVLAFSLVMAIVFWQQQRHAVERGFLERVRAMAIALDREHTGIIQVLGAMAHSPYLDDPRTCRASTARPDVSSRISRSSRASC
jgi:hypothetical protein